MDTLTADVFTEDERQQIWATAKGESQSYWISVFLSGETLNPNAEFNGKWGSRYYRSFEALRERLNDLPFCACVDYPIGPRGGRRYVLQRAY